MVPPQLIKFMFYFKGTQPATNYEILRKAHSFVVPTFVNAAGGT